MGDRLSKHNSEKKVKKLPRDGDHSKTLDRRVLQAFNNFSNGKSIVSCNDFTKVFGKNFGIDLWQYLSNGASEEVAMDAKMFSEKFSNILEHSSQSFVEMLAPTEHMLRICAQCAGVEVSDADDTFITILSQKMKEFEHSVNDLSQWLNSTCPYLFDAVQSQIKRVFISPEENNVVINRSRILSPFQMWFLQCSLPDIYFANTENEENKGEEWALLYSSFNQGISTTKFQQLVFSYRGPTITIIEMEDFSTVVLAVDQEWRNSGVKFGGANCVFVMLTPVFKKTMRDSPLYCNFKLRNQSRKLSFEDEFELDPEFGGIRELETFGCGNSKTLEEKRSVDERQKRQMERNKKVPLPGKWDENPDKLLLQLSGVYSTENYKEVFPR